MQRQMYKFRREDNDDVIEVDWSTMMTQDVAGFITLPDGVKARRCPSNSQLGNCCDSSGGGIDIGGGKEIESDSLGFIEQQFDEFELDRVKNGHVGVRFERDPDVPQFFKVKCSSRGAWDAYVKHRGMFDKNRANAGVSITQAELDAAAKSTKSDVDARQEKWLAAGL